MTFLEIKSHTSPLLQQNDQLLTCAWLCKDYKQGTIAMFYKMAQVEQDGHSSKYFAKQIFDSQGFVSEQGRVAQ